MTPKILLWSFHPGDLLGEIIVDITHGPAEHAGFLRGNGLIHELYLPRVRDRKMLATEAAGIRCFDIESITDPLGVALESSFTAALAVQINYSVEDLFRVLFNVPMPNERASYCSRYVYHTVATMLPEACWPLVRCTDDFITPRDLLIAPRLHEIALPAYVQYA
jgi:hypothetical protein